MDRKKNGLVILGLLIVIAIVAAVGLLLPRNSRPAPVTVTDPGGMISTLAPESPAPAETSAPAETIAPANTSDPEQAPEITAEYAADTPRAWLLITVDDKTYKPYPLTKTGDYTISQKKKNATNVIHVTEDSIQMASSTCDNQLCVTEGVVTLENKAGRILGNYIICLPNGVTLELLNAEEYTEFMNRQ